jgi:hypothetical protein
VQELVGAKLLNLSPWDNVDDHFRELEHGARGFGRVLLGQGITIYCDPVQAKESFVHVEVKGQGLEGVPLEEIIALLVALEDSGSRWQCSRLDGKFDHCGFSPTTVNDAARRGDVRVPFKRRAGWRKFIDSAEAEPGAPVEDDDGQGGQTCYIGKAKSPRQLCVYNRRGFTRCEFRLRGERANAVLRDLLTRAPHQWPGRFMDHLADFISFCDVSADPCVSRCPPLPWWKEFIADAKRACLKIPRALPKVFEASGPKRKRATREMAIQAEVFSESFVVAELREAKKHLTDNDFKRVRVLRSAVAKVTIDMGEDIARASCWPDQSVEEMMRSWSRESAEKASLSA